MVVVTVTLPSMPTGLGCFASRCINLIGPSFGQSAVLRQSQQLNAG